MAAKKADSATPQASSPNGSKDRLSKVLDLTYEMNNPLQVLMSLAEMDGNRETVKQVQRLMDILARMRSVDTGSVGVAPRDPEGATGTNTHELPDFGRILIADDESMVRRVFIGAITKAFPQIQVDEASDGNEACSVFASKHPAIVIMDVVMPAAGGWEGFEAIRKTCAERRWEMPAFIFCSGYEISAEIRTLTAEGSLHSSLQKPFKIADLIRTVSAKLVERNAD